MEPPADGDGGLVFAQDRAAQMSRLSAEERRRTEMQIRQQVSASVQREVQQQIAFDFGETLVGYELDAIIDSQVEDGLFLGRTFADAPEIDGNIYVSGEGIEVGQMVPVEIVEAREYDLVGVFDPEGEDE